MSDASGIADAIVVGSGASAVHAAWPLVMAGCRVLMLDVGMQDGTYGDLIPDRSFDDLRRTDRSQHRYLLGERFEGVPVGTMRVGAQLTPPRSFINRDVERLTPLESENFVGMESLAVGGLAAGWGAGVGRFTSEELAGLPVTLADLQPHYGAVERRIGTCGEDDDLTATLGVHDDMMPPLPVDANSEYLLSRYRQRREALVQSGLRLGVTRLAACSREFAGRAPHRLHDLDFWSDAGRSVYRPRWTLDELRAHENFTYASGVVVQQFREAGGTVTVCGRRVDGGMEQFTARSLVLAAGVFGTARIVLRSLGLHDRPVPYVCNPYTYAPCLLPGVVGRQSPSARHSLSQLTATFAPPGGDWPPMHVSVYSYRSLLTFKLIKESPLSARAGVRMLPALVPLLVILGLHHADEPSPGKSVTLLAARDGRPERLRIAHAPGDGFSPRMNEHERLLFRQMRQLGCYPFKRVRPGPGSSIHYAGTFPMSDAPGELGTDRNGLLSGTKQVYLADGSLLRRLPAKGLTLTLMANADRIGSALAGRL
jgi:choline dehydrogenase-like flavoprotein